MAKNTIESKRDLIVGELKRKIRQESFRESRNSSSELDQVSAFIRDMNLNKLNNVQEEFSGFESAEFLDEIGLLSLDEEERSYSMDDLITLVKGSRTSLPKESDLAYFFIALKNEDLKFKLFALIGLRRILETLPNTLNRFDLIALERLLEIFENDKTPIVQYECLCVLANLTSKSTVVEINRLVEMGVLKKLQIHLISGQKSFSEQSCITLGNILSEQLVLPEKEFLIQSILIASSNKIISAKTLAFTLRNISLDYSLSSEIKIKIIKSVFLIFKNQSQDSEEIEDLLCALYHLSAGGDREKEFILSLEEALPLLKRTLNCLHSDKVYFAVCVLANISETEDLSYLYNLLNDKELIHSLVVTIQKNDSRIVINSLYLLTNICKKNRGFLQQSLFLERSFFEFLKIIVQNHVSDIMNGYIRDFISEFSKNYSDMDLETYGMVIAHILELNEILFTKLFI